MIGHELGPKELTIDELTDIYMLYLESVFGTYAIKHVKMFIALLDTLSLDNDYPTKPREFDQYDDIYTFTIYNQKLGLLTIDEKVFDW